MLDWCIASVAHLAESLVLEVAGRTWTDWLICLAPILFFLEVPRYYFPLVGLLIVRRFGLRREDPTRREAFLRRNPKVSVIIAGRNEEETIEAAIGSLLRQSYPNFEIIVVDDHSEDGMYRAASKFARRGLIRLIRNRSGRGRLGKPSAFNLGVRVANGEFVICLDADTTYDRRMIQNIIAPFADPAVGVVAGNVHCRNAHHNLLTKMQTLEYALAIDLHKRWSDLFRCTLQGSGAISAFRMAGLGEILGWEQELAEDTDISLRMVKAGWRIDFAPEAIAMTEVPTRLSALVKQRSRWDRGGLRTFFKKHKRLMRPSVSGWSFATELWAEFAFAVLATLVYPFYLVWLLWWGPGTLIVVWLTTLFIYMGLSLFALYVVSKIAVRVERPEHLIGAALATPFLKGVLRWARFRATLYELLRVRYEDPFLPETAWVHAPRY